MSIDVSAAARYVAVIDLARAERFCDPVMRPMKSSAPPLGAESLAAQKRFWARKRSMKGA